MKSLRIICIKLYLFQTTFQLAARWPEEATHTPPGKASLIGRPVNNCFEHACLTRSQWQDCQPCQWQWTLPVPEDNDCPFLWDGFLSHHGDQQECADVEEVSQFPSKNKVFQIIWEIFSREERLSCAGFFENFGKSLSKNNPFQV